MSPKFDKDADEQMVQMGLADHVAHELLTAGGDGWTETTLGDAVSVVNGGTPSTKQEQFWGGEITWITTTELTACDGRTVDSSKRTITDDGLKSGATKMVRAGTTLVRTTATIGTCAMAACDLTFNQQISGLIPKTNKVDDVYLFYWIQFSKPILENLSAGTSFRRISTTALKTVSIKYPPLAEQKRIVDLISTIDSYIEALRQQLETAKVSRNAVLHELLTESTDDWVEVALGEVLEISRGGSPRPIQEYLTESTDGINWVKIADATKSEKYIFSTLKKIKKEGVSRSREVFSGDFILSNSMSFGRPYIMRTDGCIHDGWLLLSNVRKNFDEDFLYNLLNSDYVQSQFESLAAGSGVRNLNIEVVRKVKVRIPSIEIQKNLVSVINHFDHLILRLIEQLSSSLDLRRAFLSDLLSGDHEIPAGYDQLIGAA